MPLTPTVLDVLLVEDDEGTRDVLVDVLHERGLEPRPCSTPCARSRDSPLTPSVSLASMLLV